jgi:23S rRNA (guanosine2251-2'-O)-methyltransferase
VLEALRSGRPVDKIWFQEGAQDVDVVREIRRRVREERIPFHNVERAVLERLTGGGNHQGIVAAIATHEYATWADVEKRAKERNEEPLVLVLDEIQDPHNLGSLIRTADAAGFHGVVVPPRRAAGLTGTVSKASAGADAWMPVIKTPNIARFLQMGADNAFHIIGADSSGTLDYREARYDLPLLLVMGGEHKGLGRLIEKTCHQVVRIPMRGQVGSLNVSVAGALLMYEAVRQREKRAGS